MSFSVKRPLTLVKVTDGGILLQVTRHHNFLMSPSFWIPHGLPGGLVLMLWATSQGGMCLVMANLRVVVGFIG